MRKLILMVLLAFPLLASAQLINPVEWTFEAKKLADGQYEVHLKASIDEGWYIYSSNLESDMGPIPTAVYFEAPEGLAPVGDITEKGNKKSGYDELFDMNITKFANEVTFIQQVKVPGSTKSINGSVEYMTCDDNRCLPPRPVSFSIKL